jgi:hypothetical protein
LLQHRYCCHCCIAATTLLLPLLHSRRPIYCCSCCIAETPLLLPMLH